MRLILVRHGASPNNAEGRFTGHTDVPLSQLGRRQAVAVAGALAAEPLAVIVSSDLARARETGDIIAARTGAPLELDANLREIGMGAWEGLTYAEIQRGYPGEWARWQDKGAFFAPPGGEEPHAMLARVSGTLKRSLGRHPDECVLWVTHGGVIGALICQVMGFGLEHRDQLRRDNAAITELLLDGPRATLIRLNESAHLRDLPRGEEAQLM
jgi:probable phosphoglycerate mutase